MTPEEARKHIQSIVDAFTNITHRNLTDEEIEILNQCFDKQNTQLEFDYDEEE